MVLEIERPTFISAECSRKPQRLLMAKYILPWAEKHRNGPILDVASGLAIESDALRKQGIDVISIDASREMLTTKGLNDRVEASSSNLPIKSDSVSGVLVKDFWIFVEPDAKLNFLKETKRVLKPGDSLMIISQLGDVMRMHYKPHDSQYAFKEPFPENENWQQHFDQLSAKSYVYSVEFKTTPQSSLQQIKEVGLKGRLIKAYSYEDPLAQENRWVQRAGFIVEAIKQ